MAPARSSLSSTAARSSPRLRPSPPTAPTTSSRSTSTTADRTSRATPRRQSPTNTYRQNDGANSLPSDFQAAERLRSDLGGDAARGRDVEDLAVREGNVQRRLSD